MTEARHRSLDIGFKVLSAAGAVVLFFYGIWSYRQGLKDESAKEFWKQQFPIYVSLTQAAATIGTGKDVEKAKAEFWRMYYGDARLVVDEQVHKKLSAFAYNLKMFDAGLKTTDDLMLAAFELSTACRLSMARSWSIPLSQLTTESINGK